MFYLIFFVWDRNLFYETKTDILIYVLLIPIFIFVSSYMTGKIFIKKNGDTYKVDE